MEVNDPFEEQLSESIDNLPAMDPLHRIRTLQLSFMTMFPDEASFNHITPLRKKILLMSAELIDVYEGADFYKGIFEAYNIPYDSKKLKELAEK